MYFRNDPRPAAFLGTFAITCLLATGAWAAFDETVTLDGNQLVLVDLIGEVRIEQHAGSDFEVLVRVRGDDGSRENVQLVTERIDGGHRLIVAFPVGDETRYVYPEMGRSKTNLSRRGWDDRGPLSNWLSDLARRKITVSGRGRGLEVWADVRVRVPRGGRVRADVGVGGISIDGIHGDADLRIANGHVDARGVDGNLEIDTGSGHVNVSDVTGNVSVDTGSGHVAVHALQGSKVSIDTGSGHVEAEAVSCTELSIDTGSGHVDMRDLSCEELSIDTGSGSVNVTGGVRHAAEIDTGSGRVVLRLEDMGTGRYAVDTGSGGIVLELPALASARIEAQSGSGGIRIDVDEPRILHREYDEAEFEIGAGDAMVSLETDSGGVRITQR